MKKFWALLLAALMLLSMTATAETADDAPTALVTTIGNITLAVTQDGETTTYPLDDLSVLFAINTEEAPVFTLAGFQGDDTLAYGVAKLTDEALQVAISGLDTTYENELPEMAAGQSELVASVLRALLPAMVGNSLPMIDAVPLPKADLSMLAGIFATDTTENGDTTTTDFEIPAETVAMAIDQLSTLAESVAEQVAPLSSVVELLDSLKDSGLDISLAGSVTDSSDEQVCEIGVYIASSGETAEEPTVVLTTTSVENNFNLAVSMPSEGETFTLGELNFATDPEDDVMALNLDVLGMANFTVTTSQEGAQQAITLDSDIFGETTSTSLTYGKDDNDMDFCNIKHESAGVTAEIASVGSADEDGNYGGSIAVDYAAETLHVEFSADFYDELGEYDSGIEMPEETAPISDLNDEEAQEALAPLIEYISTVLVPEAA